jgi:trk system potassium uptake protein TrkH
MGMILFGACMLTLPVAAHSGHSVGFLDAFFTSTSAVCVTGLVTVDTGTVYSLFGQLVIIALIQAGGLGFMTVTTLIFIVIRKKISLSERMIIRDQFNEDTLSGMVRLIKRIIMVTFISEFIGAILLSIRFIPDFGVLKGIYFSCFHAISAFCNAGFDLIGNYQSFLPYANDFIVNFTICGLIVTGGIGFFVILDIAKKIKEGHKARLDLHSKIVLIATAALIVVGALAFFLLEKDNPATIGSPELSQNGRFFASVFQSVTPRTAGFNTIDQNSMGGAAKLLTVILMFIGASPAGTGGGVKTTTATVIFLLILAVIRGKKDVNVMKKRIDSGLIMRAVVTVLLSFMLVMLVTFILSLTEQKGTLIQTILFEVTSAFGTVGLSCGLTPSLTIAGKLLIILTMYGGRVGLLTLSLALVSRQKETEAKIRYPEGRIII